MKLWRVAAGVLAVGVVAAGVTPALPVPAAAKVELGDDEVFYRLDRMTRPRTVVKKTYWPFRDLGIMGGRGDTAGAPQAPTGVNVRQQMVLGPFSVARLTGSSGTAVTDWLHTNGYVVPETLAANLTRYLTAYTATYRDPSRITDDFTFEQAATDDEFQRVNYVTKNEGFWSTVGVLFGGLLLIGGAAAVVGRVLVRRSSTGRR